MWEVSATFKQELRRDSHTVAVKAEVLDTAMQPVIGGVFYDTLTAGYMKTSQFQNIVIDGNVDVDTTRDTQRTFEVTILNSNGEFSPGSTWGGLFYINRIIRLWRGLSINGRPEWVPIGTFMIDSADTIVERGMSTVVLAGSDLWKKFSKALMLTPGSYAAATTYNAIIAAQASAVGITGKELALDPLTERATAAKQLSAKLAFERGDNRGEFLSAMCARAGIDIYFDPMGVLRTQDFNSTTNRQVVWQYYDAPGGCILSLRRTFSDDNFFNEVTCVGTGNTTTTYVASMAITDASNPLSIDKVGRRTKVIESRSWDSQSDVNTAVPKYWDQYRVVDETVELEAICNPALEGNDIISIRETTFTDMGDPSNLTGRSYRLSGFSIPLSSSRSKLAVTSHWHL